MQEANPQAFCARINAVWQTALQDPLYGVECDLDREHADPEEQEEQPERFEDSPHMLGSQRASGGRPPVAKRGTIYELPFDEKEQHFGKMPQD